MCSYCVVRKHGFCRLENPHASFREQLVNGPVEWMNLLGQEKVQWAEDSVLPGHPGAGRSFLARVHVSWGLQALNSGKTSAAGLASFFPAPPM